MANCFFKLSLLHLLFISFAHCRYEVYRCNDRCPEFVLHNENMLHDSAKKCKVRDVPSTSYPGYSNITAPSPLWHNCSWYILKNSKIALNMSWHQTGTGFQSLVKGYFLTITRSSSLVIFRRKFTFIDSLASNNVLFSYACFGIAENEDIKPGVYYDLYLKALPMYHNNPAIIPQEDKTSVKIPDCEDENIKQSWHCMDSKHIKTIKRKKKKGKKSKQRKKASMRKKREKKKGTRKSGFLPALKTTETANVASVITTPEVIAVISIVALSSVLFLIIAISCICQGQSGKSKSVLMLISTFQSEEDSVYFNIASCLATILKRCGEVELSFNLWENSKCDDSLLWMREKTNIHDHIILICTPQGKINCNTSVLDPFVLGVKLFLKEKHRKFFKLTIEHTFSIIYFEDDPKVSIPESLFKSDAKLHLTTRKFSSFFKKVTGKDSTAVSLEYNKYLNYALSCLSSDCEILSKSLETTGDQSLVNCITNFCYTGKSLACNRSENVINGNI